MMISRYILPLFIALLVGALIFKGLRSGKRAGQSDGDAGHPPAVTFQSERQPGHTDVGRHLQEDGKDRALRDARALYNKRDFSTALARLDAASGISPPDAGLFNLRGSCHARLLDFEMALADFEKAADLMANNPSIRFNISEMHFVTGRWQQALDGFEKLKGYQSTGNANLSRLVEFKILLCKNSLGRAGEVETLAAKHDDQDPSPYYWYASALIASESGDQRTASELLNQASQKFPNPRDLALWTDTMSEYRST
jgi:tetratricopeptide (TPR) repeat protein